MDDENVDVYRMKYYTAVHKIETVKSPRKWMKMNTNILSEIREAEVYKHYLIPLMCRSWLLPLDVCVPFEIPTKVFKLLWCHGVGLAREG